MIAATSKLSPILGQLAVRCIDDLPCIAKLGQFDGCHDYQSRCSLLTLGRCSSWSLPLVTNPQSIAKDRGEAHGSDSSVWLVHAEVRLRLERMLK